MPRLDYVALNAVPYRLSFRRYTDRDYTGYDHCHQGMEFLYIHRGRGSAVVGGRRIEIAPGMLLYFQPYQIHRFRMEVTPETPYERTIVSLEPAVFQRYFEAFPHLAGYFRRLWREQLSNQIIVAWPDPEELPRLFAQYDERLAVRPESERIHEFGLLVVQLFHTLHRLGFGETAAKPADNPRVMRHAETIMNWIEDHYHENFELSQLADALHLTKSYVSRVFRLETGSSLTEYVTARRMRQACWLLSVDDMTVEQVGLAVGLPNFSYFCHLFKKCVGVSPSHYRKTATSPLL